MRNESKIIVKIDPEMRELIPKFLERMREKSAALESAFVKKDFAVIAGLGHRIKGSAEGYGFHQLTEMAGRLETAAEDKHAQVAESILREIVEFLNKVEIVYES